MVGTRQRRPVPTFDIVATSPLPEDLLARFADRLRVRVAPLRREALFAADGLITLLTDRVDADIVAGTRVRVVSNIAVGYDNLDVEGLRSAGVIVTHTPGVLTDATADLALLLILATLRRLLPAVDDLRRNRWPGWRLDDHLGHDPQGRVLGIVGLGRIGRATARRAEAIGMAVRYWSPSGPKADAPWPFVPLDDLLAQADVVSLHLALTPSTERILDARRLSAMKPGSILVNTARGGLVDETALVHALRYGPLAAAGLDVYAVEPLPPDSPLRRLPNVVLTPHIGSATVETRRAMVELALENTWAALSGRPQNVVPAGG
jgi:glyoxylate reductase